MNRNQSGYILVLTVILLSIGLVLVTQLFQSGTVHIHFDQAMIDREQAKQLAKGCIQLVMTQLTMVQTKTGQDETQNQKKLLTNIMAVLNLNQQFELKKDIDGIDAQIGFCLVCENGKIDINALFDFKEKKFKGEGQDKGDMKKALQAYCKVLQPFVGNKDLCEPLEKFLKKRDWPLNDVTELLEIKEFQTAFAGSVFYQPPTAKTGVRQEKRPVYLTDIFTTFSKKPVIQPLMLSDSLRALLGLKRADAAKPDIEKNKKQLEELFKDFNAGAPLQQLWDKYLQPGYGKDFKSLPAGTSELLDAKFEPTVFSVLCYANVGTIRQELWAILTKRKPTDNNPLPYAITKLYWLP